MGAKHFLLFGAIYGFLGVAAGAFGAHALKSRLDDHMIGIFETAVKYQLYHAIVLLFICWAITQWNLSSIQWAGYFFAAGILIFSGSLYTLVFTNVKAWGAITPIGGLMLLIGWLLLAISALRIGR